MPWCPNCNMEYDESETLCKGCGLNLLADTLEKDVFEAHGETSDVSEVIDVSEDSNSNDGIDFYKEETEAFERKMPEDTNNTAPVEDLSGQVEEYISLDTTPEDTETQPVDTETQPVDTETQPEETETLTEEEEKEFIKNIKHPDKSNTYIKKEEQYKDLISSAYSFLLIAVLGIGLLVLNVLGVIQIFNGILSYLVMGVLFIAFLYVGITSFTKSLKVKTQITEENQVTDKINQWLSKNVTATQLESFVNPEDTEEVKFMHKLDKMKELITATFGELDELYLDRLVEEYYNDTFESNNI